MYKLCNIDIKHSQEVYKKINQLVAALKRKFLIEQIYLFGSLAKGEMHEGSDIDLIIVGDFEGRIFERIGEVLKLTDLPVEPLVYRPAEFRRALKTNQFLKTILKDAKKLC